MDVNDLMTRLSIGELSNLSMSGEGSGTITENRQAAVISHANDGLLQLYSRFVLSEKVVVIQMIDGVTNYYLMKRFAHSARTTPTDDPLYIVDRLDPYEEDLIKILGVEDHVGRKMILNDKTNRFSLFTPKFNQLQVPRPVEGLPLSVYYQAKHRKLEPGVMEAPIYLPDVLEKALQYYIAGEIFSNMTGPENSAKGQEFRGKYEDQCALVVDRDLVNNTPDTTSEIFTRNGWI